MMMSQGSNQNSAKFSRLCLKSKTSCLSSVNSKPTHDISKYFTKTTQQQSCSATVENSNKNLATDEDSPYKMANINIETVLLNSSTKNDFKTPQLKKGQPKKSDPKNNKTISKKPKTKPMQNWKKFLKDNFQNSDVNSDHLQLALALSKSTEQFPEEEITTDCLSSPRKSSKQLSLKETLRQFGFRTETTKSEIIRKNVEKKRKNCKFKYITPILNIRTQEEREKLVAEKVSFIISLDSPEENPIVDFSRDDSPITSRTLRNFRCEFNKIFKLDSSSVEELADERFYVKDLQIPREKNKCGSLLKNWHEIAGREVSPCKINGKESFDSNDEKLTDLNVSCAGSRSPDLFEDDGNASFIFKESGNQLSNLNCLKDSLAASSRESGGNNGNYSAKIETQMNNSRFNTHDDTIDLTNSSHDEDENSSTSTMEIALSERNSQMFNITDFVDRILNEGVVQEPINLRKLHNTPQKTSNSGSETEFPVFAFSQTLKTDKETPEKSSPAARSPLKLSPFLSSSQESGCVSDEELNYSSAFRHDLNNEVFGSPAALETIEVVDSPEASEESLPVPNEAVRKLLFENDKELIGKEIYSIIESSPLVSASTTTSNQNLFIKTRNVTPMPDYDAMTSPNLKKELRKFGLKAFKRKRGIQMLKYIYESTHPVVERCESDDEDGRVVKRVKNSKRKLEDAFGSADERSKTFRRVKSMEVSVRREVHLQLLGDKSSAGEIADIVGNLLSDGDKAEDLFFENKTGSKISSCRLPLHIAWHNFLANRPDINESILCYEPLRLEVLYSMLKSEGYKYRIQDLLTFLDKKCITIRTNQNVARRKKKSTSKKNH